MGAIHHPNSAADRNHHSLWLSGDCKANRLNIAGLCRHLAARAANTNAPDQGNRTFSGTSFSILRALGSTSAPSPSVFRVSERGEAHSNQFDSCQRWSGGSLSPPPNVCQSRNRTKDGRKRVTNILRMCHAGICLFVNHCARAPAHTRTQSAQSKLEAKRAIALLAYFRTGQWSKSVQPP